MTIPEELSPIEKAATEAIWRRTWGDRDPASMPSNAPWNEYAADAVDVVKAVRSLILTEYLEKEIVRFRNYGESGLTDWGLVVECLKAMLANVKRDAGGV